MHPGPDISNPDRSKSVLVQCHNSPPLDAQKLGVPVQLWLESARLFLAPSACPASLMRYSKRFSGPGVDSTWILWGASTICASFLPYIPSKPVQCVFIICNHCYVCQISLANFSYSAQHMPGNIYGCSRASFGGGAVGPDTVTPNFSTPRISFWQISSSPPPSEVSQGAGMLLVVMIWGFRALLPLTF